MSFTPLGIPNFKGSEEEGYIYLNYEIKEKDAVELTLQVRDGNSIWYEEKIIDADKLSKGQHKWQWDGFDNSGILDTAKLTNAQDLSIHSIVEDRDGNTNESTTSIKLEYKEANWIHLRISKETLRIDVTLLMNLKEGEEKGTRKDCKHIKNTTHPTSPEKCPWDKVSAEAQAYWREEPLKERTMSHERLIELSIEGVNIYWSRNKNNQGKNVIINNERYEVFVNSEVSEKGMAAPEISFVTNEKAGRSRNWEASRILFYNVGYIYHSKWKSHNHSTHLYINKGWYYRFNNINDYKLTAAHEIGHEIILAIGGQIYSKGHKGTSTIITQKTKDSPLPNSGEIDLMKYYDSYYDEARTVASMKDVLGLIWLSKLTIKK